MTPQIPRAVKTVRLDMLDEVIARVKHVIAVERYSCGECEHLVWVLKQMREREERSS